MDGSPLWSFEKSGMSLLVGAACGAFPPAPEPAWIFQQLRLT